MFAFLGLGIGELAILAVLAIGAGGMAVIVLFVLKGSKALTTEDELGRLRIELDRLREENDRLRAELKHAREPRGAGADTGIKQA